MTKIYCLLLSVISGFTVLAQTNPAAQTLPYSQDFSSLLSTSTAYPDGWQGWTIGTSTSTSFRTVSPTGDRALVASGTASLNGGNIYNYSGKIGFLTTGSLDVALALALNTTGKNNISVSYDAMTIRNPYDGTTNTRINEMTLQFRVGTSGAFTTLTGIEYQNNTILQTGSVTTPQNVLARTITLPSSCDNQSVVQLRWVNRDFSGGGARPSFALDNISVNGLSTPGPQISVIPTSLSGFNTIAGTASVSQTFTVSGTNLTSNITITAPSPYEVSVNNSTYSSALTINQSGGTLNSTTVYTRISTSALPGPANGSITLTSGTATNSVSLSGTVAGVINLTASPYSQNFNDIGSGLPAGISVKTGTALASSLGTDAIFATAPALWNNTGGGFKNFASGNNEQGVVQNSATDRAIGVRQISGTDPGVAFVFQIANSTGKINFTLDFNLQSLDATSPRLTTWRVDYGFGLNPSSFTVPSTTGILTTGGNTFSNNPVHVDFGNSLDNRSDVITIRIVALTPSSGSGNRPSTGIDDLTLTWEDPAAKTISLNATAINFPVTKIAESKTASYKIISQTNLDQPINITATAPYSISEDNVNFNSNLSIAPASAFDKTIYVKFSPTTANVYSGTITHSSHEAATKIINLSGEAIDPNALTFNFNSCSVSSIPASGFLSVNITGNEKWKCSQFGRNSSNGVDVNGFSGGSAQNNDVWLISPALSLNDIVNIPVLSFYSRGEFTGPKLQLYVSTSYDGASIPTPPDWAPLEGNFPTPPGSATTTWTFSDNIDLSAYKSAAKVYLAFRYTSSPTLNAARWSVDDIAITDQSTLLTVTPTQLDFGEVSVSNSSAGQAINIKAIGNDDLSVTPPAGYQISTDNTSFTSSAIVVDAGTAAEGTTLYVRFSPFEKQLKVLGNINVSATGLNKNIVTLSGSSFPKSETFDVACYNISFFGSNSTNSPTPAGITTQINNISTVIQKLNMDVIGIEEMSSDSALGVLVSNLPGYSSVVSHRWSYSFNPPDPTFPPQKVGFIYNSTTMSLDANEPPRVMFERMYDSARLNLPGHRLNDYPSGTPSSFWASGRLPFMTTFNATIDGVTQKIRLVVIHAKSGGDPESYVRRQYDVKVLKDSLDAFYPNDKVIIIGDYNDRVSTSIYTGHESSFKLFVDDNARYNVLTMPLDLAGKTSFPSSNGLIDHLTVTNETDMLYISNSTDIEDARAYIPNYNATTASDHLPVFSRYQFCKITPPSDLTVSNDPGQCGAMVTFNISSTTTCGTVTAVPAPGSFFPLGTTTVKLTSGTGDSATFKVTVTDAEKPEITAPANLVVNTDAGQCGTSKESLNLGNATYSDNCSGTTVINDAPSVFPAGTTIVTWTATDGAGNTSTATQSITVADNEVPAITSPADIIVNSTQGLCSATVTPGNAQTSDNCGVSSVTNNAPANGVYTVGTHIITWTVTDIHGNSSTASQKVTVNDNENPVISTCPLVPVLCYNASGNYSIPAIAATDNCGGVSYSYVINGATSRSGNSSNASGVFDIGVSTITWTVTDSHNNTSTCQTTVTVNSPVTSNIQDVYAVNPGGTANTIYVGYGPSSVTLNAAVSGGSGNYSYKWTIGSSAGPALNSTSSYTVSPTSTTTYYLNVKDMYGCSALVTTKTISVVDVRCGPKLDKVTVCSVVKGKPATTCLNSKDVADALSSGSFLGDCVNSSTMTKANVSSNLPVQLIVNGMPNPSSNYFTITIKGGEVSEKLILQVTDAIGRVVEQKRNLQTNSTIQIGNDYRAGVYIAEIIQGSVRKQMKLVKL